MPLDRNGRLRQTDDVESPLSTDTDLAAERVQLALLRQASEARRFALCRSLTRTVVDLSLLGENTIPTATIELIAAINVPRPSPSSSDWIQVGIPPILVECQCPQTSMACVPW